MELTPPAPQAAPRPQTYEDRLNDYQQRVLPESYTAHVAAGIRKAFADQYDFSGMSDSDIVDAHHARFGKSMTPEAYSQKLQQYFGTDWTAPEAPKTDSEIANEKHMSLAKELAVGAAPYLSYGVGNALAAAAKWGEHVVPVAGQVAGAVGHGINMIAQGHEAARMGEEANKVSDVDLSKLANDFYEKAAPGLIAKGYTPDQVRAWTLHRAYNVVKGGEETAASMNEGVNTAMKQEAAGALADVVTFGIDTKTGQAVTAGIRGAGRAIIGGALRKLGLDSVTRGVARAAINPLVRHFGTGALYGASDMGIRSAAEKAQDDALAGTPLPQLAYDTVVAGGKGAAIGAGVGGVLGAAVGAPLEKVAEKMAYSKALKEHLANGGTKENFIPPVTPGHALPFEPKPNVSKIPNTSPIESRPGQLRPATSEEIAALRNWSENSKPRTDFRTTIEKVNPLQMEVPPGAENDVARSIIVSEHGPEAARSMEGMKAQDAIANKLKLYADANAEMALRGGHELNLAPEAGRTTPETTLGPGVQPSGAYPELQNTPVGPMARPALHEPNTAPIEQGGRTEEPVPATENATRQLPGREPLGPPQPLPSVPPVEARELPTMLSPQGPGGESSTFGERALPEAQKPSAPPSTEDVAKGWAKEFGLTEKKPRAPKGSTLAAAKAPKAAVEAKAAAITPERAAELEKAIPVIDQSGAVHVGVPQGDVKANEMHAALDAITEHADKAGLPVTADLTRIDAPQGGRIPVEKQLKEFWEPRGFKVVEETRAPEGQLQTVRVRRDAVPPPPGGVLEAQGTMFSRIADKADAVSKAAGQRLATKLGRMNVGFDASMIGDAALEMTGAMFAKGLRGVDAMQKYLLDRYGSKVRPYMAKVIELAGKHYTRFFKSEGNATKQLQDLMDLQESGKYGMDWYEKTANWANEHLGRKDANMFLRFLAVTSANGQTESGAALALKAFSQWKSGMEFTGMRGPSMVGQLERIAKGENLGESTKIENFYQALVGNPDAVVLDRWMLRALGIRNQSALSESNYKLYASAVKHLAEMNDMTPRQFQAAVWEGARVGNIIEKEAAGGRAASTKTGSARPLEDLVTRKMDGLSFEQYVGREGAHLKRMQNIYKALQPVRTGESVGHTFNIDTMEPDTQPGFVTSLISTNVPRNSLYPGRIEKVIKRVQPLIDHLKANGYHPTIGVFALEHQPGQFSIDLNATLPDKAQALALGAANRQESIAHLGDGGNWIENIPTAWDRKGKQFVPPKDGREHREWYNAQMNRIKQLLKETQ